MKHIVTRYVEGKLVEFSETEISTPPAPPKGIPPKPIPAVPRDKWPPWAAALAYFATPNDKGLGDTVARTIGYERSEAFKTWFKRVFGKDCGCNGRHAQWNLLYPL